MREYGFRVYNPRDKKMHYDITGFEFLDSSNMSGVFIDGDFYLKEEVYIMQFTGLHDKNGKEIYEGDIVSKETFDDTKPNYRNISYAKVVWIEELASYHLVNKDDKILWDLASDKYNIEVAGNIYENSDLLKGADNIGL